MLFLLAPAPGAVPVRNSHLIDGVTTGNLMFDQEAVDGSREDICLPGDFRS